MKKESKLKKVLHSFRSAVTIFVLVMVSLSAIVYLIYQRNRVDTTMTRIDDLRVQTTQVKQEVERLKRSITKLKKFSRIQTLAKDKFGLKPPKKTPVLIVVNSERYSRDREKLRLALKEEKKTKLEKPTTMQAGL